MQGTSSRPARWAMQAQQHAHAHHMHNMNMSIIV